MKCEHCNQRLATCGHKCWACRAEQLDLNAPRFPIDRPDFRTTIDRSGIVGLGVPARRALDYLIRVEAIRRA